MAKRQLVLLSMHWCVTLITALGFTSSSVDAASTKIRDARGKTVTIQSTKRIVSLTGTVTETLFALGVGKQLVGRDTSSYYPKEALSLPTVGYQHRLNAEGILRLKPSLVIGLSNVKPHTTLQQIEAAGVTVVLLKQPTNPSSSQSMIRKLGIIVGRQKRATALIKSMNASFHKLKKLRAAHKGKAPRTLFLYLRGHRIKFVVGHRNPVSGMLRLAGAKNAATFPGVKPVSAEGLLAARPQVIVLFAKGLRSVGGLRGLRKIHGLSLTPAGRRKRFVIMDDLYLGGFGPRCGRAALDLFRGIHLSKGTFTAR